MEIEPDAYNQDENFVSLKTLKTNLKEALKKSGVLHSVKAQIRHEFINSLSVLPPNKQLSIELSETELLFRSALFYFLRSKNFSYTLSVYAAECGLDVKDILSEEEVCRKLHLTAGKSTARSEKTSKSLQKSEICALEQIFVELYRRTSVQTIDTACQSDYSGAGIREMLDTQMRIISSTYQGRNEQERLFPARSMEEKMLIFQRNCEERLRNDFESQLKILRDIEISKVRLEEAHIARAELEAMRMELEATYERRISLQSDREAESLRIAAERERILQQSQYEQRQKLQRELDDLRSREINTARKLELDTQGLRLLESRLKEAQILLETREKEVSRREREADIIHRDASEKAKEEARARVQDELESLLRERDALKAERSRIDADRQGWEAMQIEASSWRIKCVAREATITEKEEEIASLYSKLSRLEIRQKSDLSEVLFFFKNPLLFLFYFIYN